MHGLICGVAGLHADLLRKGVGGSIRYSRTGNQRPTAVLVGAGRMGRHHARALARGAAFRLVSVVDPVEPDWADVHWERDLESALARLRPDAAIVAVPAAMHGEVARRCLAFGCHVLLEKPLCTSKAEALSLAGAFGNAGRVLFGGHSERFHPVFRALLDQVDPASVERIRTVRTGPNPQRRHPESVQLDLAIHDVDLAIRLLGPLVMVSVDSGAGESMEATFRSLQGAAVEIGCGYQPGRTRCWELETRRGRFQADFLGKTLERSGNGRKESLWVGEADPLEQEHRAFRRALEGRDSALDLAIQVEAIGLLETLADPAQSER